MNPTHWIQIETENGYFFFDAEILVKRELGMDLPGAVVDMDAILKRVNDPEFIKEAMDSLNDVHFKHMFGDAKEHQITFIPKMEMLAMEWDSFKSAKITRQYADLYLSIDGIDKNKQRPPENAYKSMPSLDIGV